MESLRTSDPMHALEELFREAGSAHHQAFLATKGDDPEWPIWYAEHVHERLNALLGTRLTRSQIVRLLVEADENQTNDASGVGWPRSYAEFFRRRASQK